MHRLIGVAIIALPAAGCVSFLAVQATGAAGTKIGTQTAVLDTLSGQCEQAAVVTDQWDCGTVADTATAAGKIASALQAYSSALSDLAQKSDVNASDKTLPSAANIKWIGADASTVEQAVAAVVNIVLGLWTTAYKESVLRDTIKNADPSIQIAAHALSGALRLEAQAVGGAGDAVRLQYNAFAAGAKAAKPGYLVDDTSRPGLNVVHTQEGFVSAAIALGQVHGGLAATVPKLESFAATVDAFAASHAELAKHLDTLSTDALMQDVTDIIKNLSGPSASDAGTHD